MKHTSVKLNTPVEFVNITSINPLISKVDIKVCWVGDNPNRNTTIITKEFAKNKLAQSLPGSPIVGFYNEATGDFDSHTKTLELKDDGTVGLKELTRPYGFIDLNAKVWFQKFLDDGEIEREYLMTQGYIWTGQYPEAQRIIDEGNNQSMELDPNNFKATRAEVDNGKYVFFIINEAIISKLCILGEDIEPCFEGATIEDSKLQFSFEEDFKTKLFSMMEELKDIMTKGGEQMSNQVVLDNEPVVEPVVEPVAEPITDPVVEPATEPAVEPVVEPAVDPAVEPVVEPVVAEPVLDNQVVETCPDCGKPVAECECEAKKYAALSQQHETLTQNYETLKAEKESLEAEVVGLREFKLGVEKKEKEDLINSFYMLSDADKQDVIDNINNYSLEDIEGKLSIICVRNKVSFEDTNNNQGSQTSYNLQPSQEDLMPAWLKAVKTSREKKNI